MGEGIEMGEAYNALMLAVLKGQASLTREDGGIIVKTKPGTCIWPSDRGDVT